MRHHRGRGGDPLRLGDVLSAGGIEPLAEISDGTAVVKYAIVCPWAAEHTNGDESGTYAGQYAGGALFFKCHHAHCGGRGWRDFRRKVAPSLPPRRKQPKVFAVRTEVFNRG